jgi:3-oxoacyl-[acyl-carrier protein] reductase
MNDVLLTLSKSPAARNVLGALKLPIPLPEPLLRGKSAWAARPLESATVLVGGGGAGELLAAITGALAEAGASIVVDDPTRVATLKDAAQAHARPVRAEGADDKERIQALVFDASGIETVDGLKAAYEFFHPRLGRLARSGRVVIVGRALAADANPQANAVRAALVGLAKATAKEIGKKGATANCVTVARGAEARLAPVLRWLCDARSAFVTAQPLHVTTRAKDGAPAAYVRPLDGKVAIVTGAARGIGRATALALAAEGTRVICLDRAEDSKDTSDLARQIGGTALLLDVTAADAPQKILEALGDRGVDIVVHNAGITRDKTLARMKPEHWDAVMAVNLAAVVRITDALLPKALRDGGRVVCLSSVSGIAGNVGQTNYAASKAALIGYVDALATQLAPRGITANAIAPGFIETRMTAAIPMVIREAGRRLSALGQGGLPEDVAQAITFLASPGAQGITGTTLRVCGGALIGA